MKRCRIVHKTLNYHINRISGPENKNVYFLFAPEIYHCSILLKIKRKYRKYFFEIVNYSRL